MFSATRSGDPYVTLDSNAVIIDNGDTAADSILGRGVGQGVGVAATKDLIETYLGGLLSRRHRRGVPGRRWLGSDSASELVRTRLGGSQISSRALGQGPMVSAITSAAILTLDDAEVVRLLAERRVAEIKRELADEAAALRRMAMAE